MGLSAQSSAEQSEAVDRLHLPYPLLSDEGLVLARRMSLPCFTVEGRTYYKRLTLIIDDGLVSMVFYPVFPPDESAEQVLRWLRDGTSPSGG